MRPTFDKTTRGRIGGIVQARIEWRGALAVYLGAFAIVTAFSLVSSLTHVPVAISRLLYYAAVFFLMWSVGLTQRPLTGRVGVGCAAAGTLLAWILNSASRSLGLSLGALGGGDVPADLFWVAVIGIGVLIALLIGWGWRDGRWKALIALAAVELVASVSAVVAGNSLLDGSAWLFPMVAFTTSWDAALRILASWLIAALLFRWGVKYAADEASSAPIE